MIPPAADAMRISIFGMQASANGPLAVLALSIMVIRVSGCVSAAAPVSGIAAKRSAMTKSRRLLRFVALLCRLQLSNINRVMQGL